MFCTSSEIYFYKFLPHCKSQLFKSYIDQLIEEFKKQHQSANHQDVLQDKDFLELRQELYINYEKVILDPTKDNFNMLCWREGIWGRHRAFRVREEGCSLSETEGSAFIIEVNLSSFPYVHGMLTPPEEFSSLTNKINQKFFEKYHPFLVDSLQTALIDLIFYSQKNSSLFFTDDPIIGKTNWIYLDGKIEILKKSHHLSLISRNNCQNELSILFNFAEDISSLSLMKNVITLINSNRIIKKFLKKHDKLLLEFWGKEEFAKKLQPLGISLEEWLKAV